MEIVRQFVQQDSIVNTDEFRAYNTLPAEGYQHQAVVHSKYQWAQGDAHTNSIEGYWSNLKKSIRGTHTRVSPAYLTSYLAEFDYRHSNRDGLDMFERMFLLMMAV
jgi:transposase-like protein